MDEPITTNIQEPAAIRNRNDVLKEIREHFGPKTPRTMRLIDALIAAWDTIDILTEAFGAEQAQAYIQAGFEQGEMADDDNE